MNVEMTVKSSIPRIWDQVVRHPLLSILFLSLLVRVPVAIVMGETVIELPGIFDQISYHNLALRVAGGHGFSFGELWWPITPANAPTAHWSFLYTLYLAGIYVLFGPHPVIARMLQVILVGILQPYLAYRIGERISDKNTGLAAAAITALYVYFFYYSAALMTEPFYITAILFTVYLAVQITESRTRIQDARLGIALGFSIGITLLLRQVFLLFLPFLFLWIWITRFKRNQDLPFASTLWCLSLIVCFVVPVTLYNYSRFDRLVLLNTNSGYAFFWGNHPSHGAKFIPILSTAEYRALIPEEIRHLDEAALDQELLTRGIQFVVDDPVRYVLLSVSRISPYFMFWYSPTSSMVSNISRIGSFGFFLPFMVYGLVLEARKHNSLWNLLVSPEGLLMLFAVVYSSIHILTWALIRYRLPVDAVLIPFAGRAMVDLALRLFQSKRYGLAM